MLQVHNKQSELYVRIYIQEFSIHVYKSAAIYMMYTNKSNTADACCQKARRRFWGVFRLPGCPVDPSAGWARFSATETQWNHAGERFCSFPLHGCIAMQAALYIRCLHSNRMLTCAAATGNFSIAVQGISDVFMGCQAAGNYSSCGNAAAVRLIPYCNQDKVNPRLNKPKAHSG